MNEKQVTLINEAIRLISRRAVNENAECLAQFDDVKLCCEECARFSSDRMQDVQFCNACENQEFFECRR